jgi:hypothetical protein
VEEACEAVSVAVMHPVEKMIVYPNPFSYTATIALEILQTGEIELNVYNHLGGLVEVIRKNVTPGNQHITWKANGLPAGVYFVHLRAGEVWNIAKVVKMN